jgi:hypothetical protein
MGINKHRVQRDRGIEKQIGLCNYMKFKQIMFSISIYLNFLKSFDNLSNLFN